MALTPKQQRFVEEYLTDLNATQAAIRAGYSAKTAEVIGYENLRKPHIQKYLNELYSSMGLDETRVESEHAYLIDQREDLSVKVKAIELYYKVTGKYTAFSDPTENKINTQLEQAVQKIRDILP